MKKVLFALLALTALSTPALACNWNFVVYSGGTRSIWSDVYYKHYNEVAAKTDTATAQAAAGAYLLEQQIQFCAGLDASGISVEQDYSPVRCIPNAMKDLAGTKGTLCEVFTNNTETGQYGPPRLVTWWQ